MLLSKKKRKEREEREKQEREKQEREERERKERDQAQREEQAQLLEKRQKEREEVKRKTLQQQQLKSPPLQQSPPSSVMTARPAMQRPPQIQTPPPAYPVTPKRPPAYPWSQKQLNGECPFPRCDYALIPLGEEIWLLGGLGKGGPRNDLVVINTGGTLMPSRDGHVAVFGDSHIFIFGGECEDGKCEDLLYALELKTRCWRRINVHGKALSGRRDHAAVAHSDCMYIFGGQDNGYFLQDLACFDMTNGAMPRWEYIEPASERPTGRAGHSACIYGDKIYVFGGTDGKAFFNEMWCYDVLENTWQLLGSSGHTPPGRAGHAACIVDDCIYITGGKSATGNNLSDVIAFRIRSRRWYTFQNMGPAPSARSGHSMVAFDHKIFVLNGEARDGEDPGLIHILDAGKIKYPSDNAAKTRPQTGLPAKPQTPVSIESMMHPRKAPVPPRRSVMTPPLQEPLPTKVTIDKRSMNELNETTSIVNSERKQSSPSAVYEPIGKDSPIIYNSHDPITSTPLVSQSVSEPMRDSASIHSKSYVEYEESNKSQGSPAPRQIIANEIPRRGTADSTKRHQKSDSIPYSIDSPISTHSASRSVLMDLTAIYTATRSVNLDIELGEPGTERYEVFKVLLDVGRELKETKVAVGEMAKSAAERISIAEKGKQNALKEAAYLKAKLTAITAGASRELVRIGEARAMELENKLSLALAENQRLLDEHQDKQREIESAEEARKRVEQMAEEAERRVEEFEQLYMHAQDQISALTDRVAQVEDVTVQPQSNITTTAISKANERAAQAERMWQTTQERIARLEQEYLALQTAHQQQAAELDRGRERLADLEQLWKAAQEAVDAAGAAGGEEAMRERAARERAETALRTAETGRRETLRRALDAERLWAGAQKELTALKRRSIAKHDQTAYLRQQLQRVEDQLRRKEREWDECQARVNTLLALLSDSADASMVDRIMDLQHTVSVLQAELARRS